MSKAVKAAGPNSCAGAELPFEEALKKLESIAESMESDDLPLEALLQRFEEGTKLAQVWKRPRLAKWSSHPFRFLKIPAGPKLNKINAERFMQGKPNP
jgi:exodeoxyribonuclease VII small subunit